MEVKFAYAGDGLSAYIIDDGSWDGTREDAGRFPQVDLPYGGDTAADAARKFRERGLVTAPADVRLDSLAAYEAALGSWAAETLSSPEPRWRGPGVYRFGGYCDDDGRPVATLEKIP